ncbi:MAG: PQQ-binding-like beta-propeller repeat protein, partial [Pseudomonadota bacterium]
MRLAKYLACIFMLTVAACDSLPDLPEWMGDHEKPKLPGTRIEVLNEASELKADAALAQISVVNEPIKSNENWRQTGGSPQGMTGNLQLTSIKKHDRIKIGDGNGWEQPLYSLPVIAGDTIYAMDSKGYITAHETANINKIKWKNKSAVTKDELDILGGGLAFDEAKLYVTTGRGNVFAIDALTGNEIWKISLGVPLRAAPKVGNGKIYCIS